MLTKKATLSICHRAYWGVMHYETRTPLKSVISSPTPPPQGGNSFVGAREALSPPLPPCTPTPCSSAPAGSDAGRGGRCRYQRGPRCRAERRRWHSLLTRLAVPLQGNQHIFNKKRAALAAALVALPARESGLGTSPVPPRPVPRPVPTGAPPLPAAAMCLLKCD